MKIGHILLSILLLFHRPHNNEAAGIPKKKKKNRCLKRRGRSGRWVQDYTYARHAQYTHPVGGRLGIADRDYRRLMKHANDQEQAQLHPNYRPATTYRWHDSGGCETKLMSKGGVCQLAEAKNIGRIFFLGDSMTSLQANSFVMLLLRGDTTASSFKQKDPSNFQTTITCTSGYQFIIQYIRNDELKETTTNVSLQDRVPNCCKSADGGEYTCFCYPWQQAYQQEQQLDQGITILVANTGAHLKSLDAFQTAWNNFLREWIHIHQKPHHQNDILMIRSAVPGHLNCHRPDLKPFFNFDDYYQDVQKQTSTKTLLPAYNATLQHSFNRAIRKTLLQQQNMFLLDVFHMTILRPDSHMGAASLSDLNVLRENDCIHYSLPGPTDWWNHLLYSHLLDIYGVVPEQDEERGIKWYE